MESKKLIKSGLLFCVMVLAASASSPAANDEGYLAAWGANNYGQCDAPFGDDFVAVAGGGYHGLALKSDGCLAG